MACQNFKTFVHKSDSSPEALCNLGSGSWLAWANDTAAQYAAIHCRRQQTIGPTDDDDDDDDDDESMKLMFAHSYRKKTVTSVLMKICSGKQSSQKTYHHTNQPDYAFTPSPVNYYCVDYIMWTHQSHSVAVVKNRFIQWIWYGLSIHVYCRSCPHLSKRSCFVRYIFKKLSGLLDQYF